MSLRVIFIGTGDIGLPALKYLIDSKEIELLAVVTGQDTVFGRPPKEVSPKVKDLADDNGVPVHQPENIGQLNSELQDLNPDLFIVMAYGQILKKGTLELPKIACLNLHASILPRHRGAAPIQSAILSGDKETGVTVMHMARGLDTGDIVSLEKINIPNHLTGGELHDQLGELAPSALKNSLLLLKENQLPSNPQDNEKATYAGKLERKDGRLDWNEGGELIERKIRAYHPWPGTYTEYQNDKGKTKRLKIMPQTEFVEIHHNNENGSIVEIDSDNIVLAVLGGALKIKNVQPEGSKVMRVSQFLNGTKLAIGSKFG